MIVRLRFIFESLKIALSHYKVLVSQYKAGKVCFIKRKKDRSKEAVAIIVAVMLLLSSGLTYITNRSVKLRNERIENE